jgi:tRNA (guanine-N7-)-methyltransferase
MFSMKTKNDLHIPFTWEERRPVLLDRFFYVPRRLEPVEPMRLQWSELFGNDQPVHLEICCGNGQWIGEKATAHPELNWVGLDLDFERARKTWLRGHRDELPNLYTICSEASFFIRHFASPVHAAYINFPDPWPKRKHAKKRLVQAPFLQELQKIVRGTLTLATDHEAYHQQMIAECRKAGGLTRVPYDGMDYGESYFSKLWKGKGLNIHYLRYHNVG